jgi:ACR3 family arsenite efflux pump ArsB
MVKLLGFVQKNLFSLVVLAIALGLVYTGIFGGYEFTPLLCLLAALIMIFPSLVPLNFKGLGEIKKHRRNILLTIVLNFIAIPALAVLLGNVFLTGEPGLRLGLILLAVLPGGGMVTTWAFKTGANMLLTVGIVLINLLAAVFLAPVYLSVAINRLATNLTPAIESCSVATVTNNSLSCALTSGEINPLKLAVPILFIVIFPLVLAYVTQRFINNKYQAEQGEKLKKQFAAFSNFGLVVMLALLMGVKDNKIIFEQPEIILKALLPLMIFYGFNLALAVYLYQIKKTAEDKAVAWGVYLRYITLALGLAISLVYQNQNLNTIVIMVVLAYLVQIPSSFWLARYLNKHG